MNKNKKSRKASKIGSLVFVVAWTDNVMFTAPGSTAFPVAATLAANADAGKVTTAALATAAATTATIVITNTKITAAALTAGMFASVELSGYGGTQGLPVKMYHTLTANTITVTFRNFSAADALDGALSVDFSLGYKVP